MSIFKGSFRPYVQNQLSLRQQKMLTRDDTTLAWLSNRTCFVRLTSSVNIENEQLAKLLGIQRGNILAKTHVLEGGELSYDPETNTFKQRYGLGDKFGSYGDKTNATRTSQRGLVPMSGITSVSVSSKSAFGTLQQATIKIRCHSIKELERLELLYCRVGYTVLLEFGWTTFFKNDGKYTTEQKRYNILDDNNLSKEQIFSDIYGSETSGKSQKLLESSSGNYDALYGYVTNFSYTNVSGQDNAFDITVTMLTIGEIINSLKVDYISSFNVDTFTTLDNNQKNAIQKDSTKSKLNGILSTLREYSRNSLNVDNTNSNVLNYQQIRVENYGNINFLSGYVSIQSPNSPLTQSFKSYIRFGDLVDILNKQILLSTDKGTPFVKLSLKNKYNEDSLAYAHYLQLPTDLNVCYIESCKNEDLLRYRLKLTDSSTLNESNTYFVDNKYNKAYIKNIYLNLDFLISAISDSRTDSYTNLNAYLNYILKNVNNSLGNINDFKLFCDTESDLIRIVDATYTEGKDDTKKFVLELSGLKSTVRNYEIGSMIYPNLSSTIAISAGVNSNANTGVNTTLFDLFNKGIVDRIIKQKIEPNSNKTSVEDEAKQIAFQLELPIRDYTTEINTAKSVVNSRSSEISNSLNQLIQLEVKLQTQLGNLSHSTTGILPIRLTLTMDGISGIRIGDVFKVPDDMLPIGYRGFSKNNRIGFIVTRIGHSVENNDWITDMETQTVILDEVGSYQPVKRAKIYDYSPLVLQYIQQPIKESDKLNLINGF